MIVNNLDDIERRLAALPPRPWKVEGETFNEDSEPRLAPWALEDAKGLYIWSSGGGEYAHPDLATGMFIAEAPKLIERLVAEVRWLRDALEEKEVDMHLRIRRGYDKTVSDAWRAWAAKIEKERDEARVERDSAYRRGVEQAIRSVEGEATPSALRQAERLRSMLLDDGACRDLALEIKCKQAFRRGVEAMREATVAVARKRVDLPKHSDLDSAWCRSAECILDELRGLTVPEDKP